MKQRYRIQQFTPIQTRVVKMREEKKLTFAEIGRRMNLTRERIRQIYADAMKWRKIWSMTGEKADWAKLPSRVQKVLPSLGLKTKAQVRGAIDKGDLTYPGPSRGLHWRGERVGRLGDESWRAILKWLDEGGKA
jgi:hypothetical protein